MANNKKIIILMDDDDEDDRFMARDAFEMSRLNNELFFVKDGVELLEYLRHQGNYTNPSSAPRPGPDGSP